MRQGLVGISCYKKVDAIIMAGDITNSAHVSEYKNLKHYLKKYSKVERVIPEMGNHDTRATSIEPYYNEALDLYNDFCKFCGIEKGERPYYVTDLKGYRVITISSEGIPNTDQAIISDEQLKWFEKELIAAAELKKPIFVVSHQPPAGRNGAVGGCSIGEASESLDKNLCENASSAAPVIFVSGHMHEMRGLDNPKEGLYFINMTSFMYLGDSVAANMLLDREDTPLQADISSTCCAQTILFGVCGITVETNGTVVVCPPKNRPVKNFRMENIILCGIHFSVSVDDNRFEVVQFSNQQEQHFSGITGEDRIILNR